jgi:2-keto-4-pentenoate hydratase/2-oxohepta-3-ene-1,7-dioic acid hydratase in catechol pathway
MRLVTYDRGGARRLGAWVDGTVVDLPDAVGHPSFPATMERLIEHAGGTILDAAREILSQPDTLGEFAVPDAHLMIPLLPHALRGENGPKAAPLLDPMTGLAVFGPGEEIPWPGRGSLDMTIEVACVIGGGGRSLTRKEAEEAIFGYTIAADWRRIAAGGGPPPPARNGRRSNGPGTAGSEYVALSLGPCIVTVDDFDVAQAAVNLRIDGETRSRGTVVGVKAAFSDVVRRASREQVMRAGDLFGWRAGVSGRPHWEVHPGAVVEVEAERIGVLRAIVGKRARSLVHRR